MKSYAFGLQRTSVVPVGLVIERGGFRWELISIELAPDKVRVRWRAVFPGATSPDASAMRDLKVYIEVDGVRQLGLLDGMAATDSMLEGSILAKVSRWPELRRATVDVPALFAWFPDTQAGEMGFFVTVSEAGSSETGSGH